MTDGELKLATVEPTRRVLLLSHCLRPSQSCPGKFTKQGLDCPPHCAEDCVIRRLRAEAFRHGYEGVCVAAGGAMALRFVKEHNPRGIVAVACDRELEEGVDGVREMIEGNEDLPAIVVVPLLRDGCVDTQVDVDQVMKAIALRSLSPASG